MIKTKLKLIKNGDTYGYKLKDIYKELSEKQWMEFRRWLIGQTVGTYKRDTFIFAEDYERFLKSLPVFY